MSISERIKELRLSKNLSQKDLASAIGISWRAIQNYEYGKQEPTVSVIIALANYFEVSLDTLCCFNPYRIEFDCDYGNKTVTAIAKNMNTKRTIRLNLLVEFSDSSLWLNHCTDDEILFEKFYALIKGLPAYYISYLDEQLRKVFICNDWIDENNDFSIKTNLY